MENNFDILIPGQHLEVAKTIVDYVESVMDGADYPATVNKISKEIARGKYWEAYDCKDDLRQEYWRLVVQSFDEILSHPSPKKEEGELIEDGFGSRWSKICPSCNQPTMQVMRPGKVQCSNCG